MRASGKPGQAQGPFLAPDEEAEHHGLVTEKHSPEDGEATTDDSDYEFQLAAGAARRLVSQSRTHVQQSIERLSARLNSAVDSTPCGIDRALAKRDAARGEALLYSVSQLESTSNALLSHLKGLEVLMKSDTFFPLPAMAITRSIAEIAASVVWALRPELSADERTVRSYASLFASLEKVIVEGNSEQAVRAKDTRELLVTRLKESDPKGFVKRRFKGNVEMEDVSQVTIGRAHAKTRFQYSQRLREEIPMVGGLYSQMSAAAHGDNAEISTAFATPESFARGIGHVVLDSIQHWSLAVHTWLGVNPGQFWNDNDAHNLLYSIAEERRASFIASMSQRMSEEQ